MIIRDEEKQKGKEAKQMIQKYTHDVKCEGWGGGAGSRLYNICQLVSNAENT